MGKIGLIIKREYSTRVRKKSFVIMSIIGPVLIAALFVVPIWLAKMEDKEIKNIAVIDDSFTFSNALEDSPYIKFHRLLNTTVEKEKDAYSDSNYFALLYIPANILKSADVRIYSSSNVTMAVQMHINNQITKEIERQKLRAENIDEDILESIKTNINLRTIKWTEEGEETEEFLEVKMILSFVVGFMIYMFVFMYGAQVMRGVIEEKTSRIVEVIVSSVKPFQLMMGKIIGVALVGLTQFLLWVFLSMGLITALQAALFDEQSLPQTQMISQSIVDDTTGDQLIPTGDEEMSNLTENIESMIYSVNWPLMIISFLIFFLGGYLLYASLFAAVGSAVDNETDTQQFMVPITIPLVLAIIMVQSVVNNPDGPLSFWFSMIPFTSPIIMMARIPFGVEIWEVALSVGILVLTFIGTTWMAGKIYRTGILMYGKKINYREIWKWLRYKS